MDIGMGTPLMDNLVRLRQLCQEFDIGAYMDGIEPSGMSEKGCSRLGGANCPLRPGPARRD